MVKATVSLTWISCLYPARPQLVVNFAIVPAGLSHSVVLSFRATPISDFGERAYKPDLNWLCTVDDLYPFIGRMLVISTRSYCVVRCSEDV